MEAIEFVASLEANQYIGRSAAWGDHQNHVRIFIEQICLGVVQTLAHSEQSDSCIGLQNAEGSDPGSRSLRKARCKKNSAARCHSFEAPEEHWKKCRSSLHTIDSWMIQLFATQLYIKSILVETQSGVVLRFLIFSCFSHKCVFFACSILFAATFPWDWISLVSCFS